MKTVAKKLYEAMFLVDSNLAGSDWDGVLATIKNIFERAFMSKKELSLTIGLFTKIESIIEKLEIYEDE